MIQYWQSKRDRKWYFHLVDSGNYRIVGNSSQGYETQTGCQEGIRNFIIEAAKAGQKQYVPIPDPHG